MNLLFQDVEEFNSLKKLITLNSFPKAILVLSKDSQTNFQFCYEVVGTLFCKESSFCGKCEFCVKTLSATNPDFLIYPKDKSFQVQDAKEIVETSILSPMISKQKIYLINDIDNSSIQAQNKILKVLEEPPQNVIFILNGTNISKILPTIISRCVKIYLKPLDKHRLYNYIGKGNEDEFDAYFEFGEGYLGKTKMAIEDENFNEMLSICKKIIFELKSSKQIIEYSSVISKDKEYFANVLNLLLIKFEQILQSQNEEYSKECTLKIIEEIFKTNKELESNVNFSILADNLLMKILELKYL